jgi:predicted amidohydrolase
MPVFTIGGLTFGIILCNDSNFTEPAQRATAQGATVLFVPTNNALPPEKADVVDDARKVDVLRAKENSVWVIRADVAGRRAGLESHGSSGVVDPKGRVLQSAHRFREELLVADLGPPRSYPVER